MSIDDLLNRFTHRDSTPANIGQHESIAGTLAQTAAWFRRLLPEGRELALVVTKLEEAAHWAHAAVNNAVGLTVESLPGPSATPEPVVPAQISAPAAEAVAADPADPVPAPVDPAPEHPQAAEGGA